MNKETKINIRLYGASWLTIQEWLTENDIPYKVEYVSDRNGFYTDAIFMDSQSAVLFRLMFPIYYS